jgi:hypothetical protein
LSPVTVVTRHHDFPHNGAGLSTLDVALSSTVIGDKE